MKVSTKTLPKSQVELSIELSHDELQPYLVKAAASISREHPLKGFRPGKVPLDVALTTYGAMTVYEEAVDPAVRDTFTRAVMEQQLPTVGSPKVSVTTLAPNNPVRYTATVAVLPAITLPVFPSLTVTKREAHVTTADVDKALNDLRKMSPQEALVARPATAQDKVIVNLSLTRGGAPVEGGQATNHHIYLGEEYALPKVREQLIGAAKGDVKTFALEFPKEHFQKHLAGKTVDCRVEVSDVYTVTYPELTDDFAKRIGVDSLLALRGRIRENLDAEAKQKTRQREDMELLDAVVEGTKAAELPEVLITTEAHRMVEELDQQVKARGLPFDDYLAQLKKTRDELLLGMAPEAMRRVKVALATRAIAEQHPDVCVVEDREVEEHIAAQLERYRDDAGVAERITSEESRAYIRNMLKSQKVVEWLRAQVQWKEKS